MDPKLLALATAITYGLAPVALKRGFRRGGTTTSAMIIGLVVAVPITLVPALFVGLKLDQMTPVAFGAFVLGGLAGNAVGRRWNFQSINLLGPSRASARPVDACYRRTHPGRRDALFHAHRMEQEGEGRNGETRPSIPGLRRL